MPREESQPTGWRRTRPRPWVLVGCTGASLLLVLGVSQTGDLWPLPAKQLPPAAECAAQLKQLSTALQMYCQDHDERLPPADAWADGLFPYTRRADLLVCPSRPGLASGYAFRSQFDRHPLSRIPAPEETPLLFESVLGVPNASGGLETYTTPHRGKGNVVFADGHVKSYADVSDFRTGTSTRGSVEGRAR